MIDVKFVDTAWKDFLSPLPDGFDQKIERQLPCPLTEVFDTQSNVDLTNKALFKKEKNQMIKEYFSKVSIHDLEAKIKDHEKLFVRGLGPERLNHLKLLIKLKMICETNKPRRGLLAV